MDVTLLLAEIVYISRDVLVVLSILRMFSFFFHGYIKIIDDMKKSKIFSTHTDMLCGGSFFQQKFSEIFDV